MYYYMPPVFCQPEYVLFCINYAQHPQISQFNTKNDIENKQLTSQSLALNLQNFSQYSQNHLIYSNTQEKQLINAANLESGPNFKKQIKGPQTEIQTKKSAPRLDFGTNWSNENRNIVPNIINQLISFILKPAKSGRIIEHLFAKYKHQQCWTISKFYIYLKMIKNRINNYLDEKTISIFSVIQEADCQIYQFQEQTFYMRICRCAIEHFLSSDSILISLTSKRMGVHKRKLHLTARRALLSNLRFLLNPGSK